MLTVMNLVGEAWKTAWLRMSLPIAFLNSTQGSGLSDEDAHKKCASFYVGCFPNASWQHLSGRLYQYGEEAALEKLKPYLPSKGSHSVCFMSVNMHEVVHIMQLPYSYTLKSWGPSIL